MGRKHHIRTTRRLSFLSRAFIKPSQTVDVPLTREAARHGLDHFTLHDAYNISLALRGHSTFERFALASPRPFRCVLNRTEHTSPDVHRRGRGAFRSEDLHESPGLPLNDLPCPRRWKLLATLKIFIYKARGCLHPV